MPSAAVGNRKTLELTLPFTPQQGGVIQLVSMVNYKSLDSSATRPALEIKVQNSSVKPEQPFDSSVFPPGYFIISSILSCTNEKQVTKLRAIESNINIRLFF